MSMLLLVICWFFEQKFWSLEPRTFEMEQSLMGRAGILRVTQDGRPVGHGILGPDDPLNKYYAYGIRNSFGIDFDPLTGNLWDTENGPDYGDEINLVRPGFNSGWKVVQRGAGVRLIILWGISLQAVNY